MTEFSVWHSAFKSLSQNHAYSVFTLFVTLSTTCCVATAKWKGNRSLLSFLIRKATFPALSNVAFRLWWFRGHVINRLWHGGAQS